MPSRVATFPERSLRGAALLAIALAAPAGADPFFTSENAVPAFISAGQFGVGSIDPLGDLDEFTMSARGDLFIAVDAPALGDDPALLVRSAVCFDHFESDEDDGPGAWPVIAGFPPAADVSACSSSVDLQITGSQDASLVSSYRILPVEVTDPVFEVEPNDTPEQATFLWRAGGTGGGPEDDVDFYSFLASAGDPIAAIVDKDPDDACGITNVAVYLLDRDGSTILAVGDDSALADATAAVATAPASGLYYVQIVRFGGSGDTDYEVARFPGVLDPIDHSTQSGAIELPRQGLRFGQISTRGSGDWWRIPLETQSKVFAYFVSSLLEGSPVIRMVTSDFDVTDTAAIAPVAFVAQAAAEEPVEFYIGEQGLDTIPHYWMFWSTLPSSAALAEVEPNAVRSLAQPLPASRYGTGVVTNGDVDLFSFRAARGDWVSIVLDPDPDRDDGYTAAELAILDADGSVILQGPLGAASQPWVGIGPIQITEDDTYFLRVAAGSGGTDTDYAVVVIPEAGAHAATLAIARLALLRRRAKVRVTTALIRSPRHLGSSR
jgi:hypothetical protein